MRSVHRVISTKASTNACGGLVLGVGGRSRAHHHAPASDCVHALQGESDGRPRGHEVLEVGEEVLPDVLCVESLGVVLRLEMKCDQKTANRSASALHRATGQHSTPAAADRSDISSHAVTHLSQSLLHLSQNGKSSSLDLLDDSLSGTSLHSIRLDHCQRALELGCRREEEVNLARRAVLGIRTMARVPPSVGAVERTERPRAL